MSSANAFIEFPESFTWGAATSAYQIEGSPSLDGKGDSIWDTFCRQPGRIKDGTSGDVACDHVRLYAQDVALMAELGLDAYRFSIAWTRVHPNGGGPINQKGLDFYDRLVDELLAAGIEPMPTLYHWDLPQALEDRGGWQNRDTAKYFGDYTESVLDRLGDRVRTWTTLNEPFVSANHGYVVGEHAPGITSMMAGFSASHHLLLAHGLAAERVRGMTPEARLAIVLNFTPTEPEHDDAECNAERERVHDLENRWYIDPIAGKGYPEQTAEFYGWEAGEVLDGDLALISAPVDLLGVNYYFPQVIGPRGAVEATDRVPQNTMGWEVHPPTLGRLLRWLNDNYDFASLMITENGTPMPDETRAEGQIIDDDRLNFVRDHLIEVHRAIADGVPVEGYLVWSLFDNFEWAWGYGPTFGIIEVDFQTMERRPKKSADWYRDAITANGFALPDEPTSYRAIDVAVSP